MPSRKTTKKRPAEAAPSLKSKPLDHRTDERRERVLQMWGRKPAHVAKLLLEEGFPVDIEEAPLSPHLLEAWKARRVELMRRNVGNDRAWWDERWRSRAKEPKTAEDVSVQREGYVASLESDLDEIADLLAEPQTKSTAKAILHGERRQTRALIAKARGIDQVTEQPPADPKKYVVLGVVLGIENVTEKGREQLRSQGVEIE